MIPAYRLYRHFFSPADRILVTGYRLLAPEYSRFSNPTLARIVLTWYFGNQYLLRPLEAWVP